MSLSKISRFIFHRNAIKVVSLIFIVGYFFVLPTFAQNIATTKGSFENIKEYLNTFISLCSRLRVILAILAGKLMTNDFVYGAFIHMDIYLWKIWNIMKNFANFALVGIVLMSIIKSLTGKEALDVKKIITTTLLAGILIQASRFIMGAVIDVSTVATAGISSFPMSFLKNDVQLQDGIRTSVQNFQAKRIVFDPNSTNAVQSIPVEQNTTTTDQQIWDSILPSYNSVSGPFIFLGMGVFKFQDYLGMEISVDAQTLTLEFIIRLFFLFFFTMGLLFLFIANIMRIGLLWIFIIGSPFLILMQLFKKDGGGKGIMGLFKLSNLIAIVFKPVIFVAGISLMFIVITSMQYGLGVFTRENNLNGVSLGMSGDNVSTLSVEGVSDVHIGQKDLFGPGVVEDGQNVFSYIVMLFLTLFLMRWFIKLSLTIGGGPIEETMKKLTGRAESIARTTPILPFGGGASIYGTSQIMSKNKDKMLGGFGLNKGGKRGEMDGSTFTSNEEKFNQFVNSKLSLGDPWMDKDKIKLGKIAGNITPATSATFFSTSVDLAKVKDGGISISDDRWLSNIKTLFSRQENIRAINATISDNNKKFNTTPLSSPNATDEELMTYFGAESGKNTKALYEIMGGQTAAPGTATPTSYEELKQIRFYAKTTK